VEEPEIDQVTGGMRDAADIQVYGEPAACFFTVKRFSVVMSVHVPQVIPRRADERVHRVRIPLSRAATLGTSGVHK